MVHMSRKEVSGTGPRLAATHLAWNTGIPSDVLMSETNTCLARVLLFLPALREAGKIRVESGMVPVHIELAFVSKRRDRPLDKCCSSFVGAYFAPYQTASPLPGI